MAIKCGRCSSHHESVADVRACYNGEQPATVEVEQAASRKSDQPTDNQWKFLNDLRQQAGWQALDDEQRGNFTKRSISEAINDAKLDVKNSRAAATRQTSGNRHLKAADYAHVLDGRYAVASLTGNNDLDFFKVDVPDKGNWAGYLFVKRILGGGANGESRTERVSKATALGWLAKLDCDATVQQSMAIYGQAIGVCGKCGRELSDEMSRARGIGPDCYARYF